MMEIYQEDECNDTYGRIRMYQALILKMLIFQVNARFIVSWKRLGLAIILNISRTELRKQTRKSEDLLKRDFRAEEPLTKCVTDITQIKASDGKLYVSAVFDCFDSSVIGLAMDTNMKAPLCVQTLENASKGYPDIREAICKYGIQQSMNSAGGRCHDNVRCEGMWVRMKSELLYDRYDTDKMTTDELKTLIWRYFISYWNNRRICSANEGLLPVVKQQQYYNSLKETV